MIASDVRERHMRKVTRRSDFDCICDILTSALTPEVITRIRMRANLGGNPFNRHFSALINRGLIEVIENPYARSDRKWYVTSEKGKSFLSLVKQMRKMLEP